MIGTLHYLTGAEKGDSEIEIIGGSTAHCLRAVEAVGANTIVKFTGVFGL